MIINPCKAEFIVRNINVQSRTWFSFFLAVLTLDFDILLILSNSLMHYKVCFIIPCPILLVVTVIFCHTPLPGIHHTNKVVFLYFYTYQYDHKEILLITRQHIFHGSLGYANIVVIKPVSLNYSNLECNQNIFSGKWLLSGMISLPMAIKL